MHKYLVTVKIVKTWYETIEVYAGSEDEAELIAEAKELESDDEPIIDRYAHCDMQIDESEKPIIDSDENIETVASEDIKPQLSKKSRISRSRRNKQRRKAALERANLAKSEALNDALPADAPTNDIPLTEETVETLALKLEEAVENNALEINEAPAVKTKSKSTHSRRKHYKHKKIIKANDILSAIKQEQSQKGDIPAEISANLIDQPEISHQENTQEAPIVDDSAKVNIHKEETKNKTDDTNPSTETAIVAETDNEQAITDSDAQAVSHHVKPETSTEKAEAAANTEKPAVVRKRRTPRKIHKKNDQKESTPAVEDIKQNDEVQVEAEPVAAPEPKKPTQRRRTTKVKEADKESIQADTNINNDENIQETSEDIEKPVKPKTTRSRKAADEQKDGITE